MEIVEVDAREGNFADVNRSTVATRMKTARSGTVTCRTLRKLQRMHTI